MRALTATAQTQGQHAGDFAWCDAGELVTFGSCCDSAGCGCQRAFTGLTTRKGTTTAVVAERAAFTVTDLAAAILSSHRRAGLASPGPSAALDAAREAATLAAIASRYPAGSILEIRAHKVTAREGTRP